MKTKGSVSVGEFPLIFFLLSEIDSSQSFQAGACKIPPRYVSDFSSLILAKLFPPLTAECSNAQVSK